MKFKVVSLCKKDAVSVVPQEVVRFDLDKSAEILKSEGFMVRSAGVMLTATGRGLEVTIYQNGRMLVHPAESKERVKEAAQDMYALLETARE